MTPVGSCPSLCSSFLCSSLSCCVVNVIPHCSHIKSVELFSFDTNIQRILSPKYRSTRIDLHDKSEQK